MYISHLWQYDLVYECVVSTSAPEIGVNKTPLRAPRLYYIPTPHESGGAWVANFLVWEVAFFLANSNWLNLVLKYVVIFLVGSTFLFETDILQLLYIYWKSNSLRDQLWITCSPRKICKPFDTRLYMWRIQLLQKLIQVYNSLNDIYA